VVDYNANIDSQIAEILRTRGEVRLTSVPGLEEGEVASLLARFYELHGQEQSLTFDGTRLRHVAPPPPPPPPTSSDVAPQGAPYAAAPPAQSFTPAQTAPTVPPGAPGARPSPVEQILAAPHEKSLLDTARSEEPINGAMWLLPLVLGLIGGVLGFMLVRERSPKAARNLLIVGVVIQLTTTCMLLAMPNVLKTFAPATQTSSSSNAPVGTVPWAVSPSGLPVFYYFGTST
jgi:hypothetical protein